MGKARKKRIGRPVTTGKTPMVGLRLQPHVRKAIEEWAKNQPDKPLFSDAVRRLLTLALMTARNVSKP